MLFNGKYYNKPGHLGMTRQQLKEALAGGGGDERSTIADITFSTDGDGNINASSMSFSDFAALVDPSQKQFAHIYVDDGGINDYGIMSILATVSPGVGIISIDFISAYDIILKTEYGYINDNSISWSNSYKTLNGWSSNNFPTGSFYDIEITGTITEE